jgi:hypothetical protein
LGKRINLINNFGEKFKGEKKGNFFFSYEDNELGKWIFQSKAHQNEISLPENFISLRAEGNVLILQKSNTEVAIRLDTPEEMPVIYPIDPKDSSYFAIIILDIKLSFYYSPMKGWYMFKGEDTHGEPVKLNQ